MSDYNLAPSLPKNISARKILNIGKTNKKIKKIQNLKIIHFNCNGFVSKNLTLVSFLKFENPSITSLNELRFSESNANDALRFENYNIYYKCREQKKTKQVGGGVALLVHEKLEQSEESLSSGKIFKRRRCSRQSQN